MKLFCFALFVLTSLRAQPGQRPELDDVRVPLTPETVENTLERRTAFIAARLHHPMSRPEIEIARPDLRKRLSESLGYKRLPWPPDLRTTLLSTFSGTGYKIEKLAYQTLKNVLVTAHMYLPGEEVTSAPGVLFLGGHWWNEGKAHPDAQAFGINMARLGFIVLIPNPLGTGERGPSEGDHRHAEALLVGLSQPGIAEYETQCALEYLMTRKDVDPKRIGITGVDGGGFNAWITAALDDRIAAAVPVEDTFDFADQIHSRRTTDWNQAQDQCELIPGILQYANIQELIAMAYPKPIMIIAGPGVRRIYETGQQIYGVLKGQDIRFFEEESTGYSKHRREGAYGFFLHRLMHRGDGTRVDEPPTEVKPYYATDLLCLPGGQHAMAEQGITGAIRALAQTAASGPSTINPRALLGELPEKAQLSIGINMHPVIRANLDTERGIQVPVTILRPGYTNGGGYAGVLVAIDDHDKESLVSDPIVQEALRRDYLVAEIDPRGFGELSLTRPGWTFATSLLIGENIVWRQAWDIQTLFTDLPFATTGHNCAFYARGPKASLAAAYAVWLTNSDVLSFAVLRGAFTSEHELLEHAPELRPEIFAFQELLSPDLPQLLKSAKTKTFLIDPIDPTRARAARSGKIRLTSVDEFIGMAW